MKRTYKQKIDFILNYNADFEGDDSLLHLLDDCLDMLTEEQLKEIYNKGNYEEDYEKAWEDYEFYKVFYRKEEPDD